MRLPQSNHRIWLVAPPLAELLRNDRFSTFSPFSHSLQVQDDGSGFEIIMCYEKNVSSTVSLNIKY